MKRLLLVAAAAATVAAPAARADAGLRAHDGLSLHLEGGLGGAGMTNRWHDRSATLAGAGGELAIGLGGAIARHLILGGQVWGVSVRDPSVRTRNVTLPPSDSSHSSIGLTAIGLEVTYYFMPLNLFVSAVPSFARLGGYLAGTSYAPRTGLALKLAVGKEWWVSPEWGVGLAAQTALASNEEDVSVDPGTFTTAWFGLVLSATYN